MKKITIPALAAIALLGSFLSGGAALADSGNSDSSTSYSDLGIGKKVDYDNVPSAGDPRLGAGQTATAITGPLVYRGGTAGIGVTTGAPKVYVVFLGNGWGTATTSGGITTFSNDPKGVAPFVQKLFQGIGTNGETWSGVNTQYCEGIAAGQTSCPASAAHVGQPVGGTLAGVWYDNRAVTYTTNDTPMLNAAAARAATYFGNNTPASNRNVQYMIVSPTGKKVDGFPTAGWCAWHWYTSTASAGTLAYTNLPYVPDAGASCGANFLNPGTKGLLDGLSMVAGHEYAETITDQNPAGGWTDASGWENADKCSWVSDPNAVANVKLATGSFALAGNWSNADNRCSMSGPVVAASGALAVTRSNGATAISLARFEPTSVQPVYATSSNSGLTWSATGLPAGLSINSATGIVAGSPSAAVGTYVATINASDSVTTTPIATTVSFTIVNPDAPVVSTASTTSGSVGSTLTISGNNLFGAQVTFATGVAATSVAVGAWGTSASITVPAGATSGAVTVTTAGGTVTVLSNFSISIPPSISSLSATSGKTGDTITITGANFSGITATTGVKFGGVNATRFTVLSTTTITAVVPAAAKTGAVSVSNAAGTATSSQIFTFYAAPTISSFSPTSVARGASLTINGTNLTGGTVTVGGATAAVTSATATRIIVTVPSASVLTSAGSKAVVVTTLGGTASRNVTVN